MFFITVNLFGLTDSKLSPEYGEAFFEVLQDSSLLVKFIGKCIEANEKIIYSVIVGCLETLPEFKKLQVDLNSVTVIDARCKSLINILTDCANFHSLQVIFVDPKKYLIKI